VQQAGGALRHAAEDWRRRLIAARAAIEAELDFSDEEDVDGGALAGALAAVAGIRREVEEALARSRNAPRLADGFQVAIVGPPNVGKSSLLNALAEREVAIVTEHAGTTRDVVEARLDLGGCPLVLLDTAGLREAADPVERIGIERALARARAADLVLQLAALDECSDASCVPANAEALRLASGVERLRVWTKADAAPPAMRRARRGDGFVVSAVTGEGLPALTAELAARAGATFSTAATSLVTRERHVSELSALRDALAAIAADAPLEIVAEQLRQASQPLGRLTGAIDVEDVLDALFGEFCIGK
jgi:tRNA modification GTPase